MKEIVWSAIAWRDLARIGAFNEARSPAWAIHVDLRIHERIASLAVMPMQGRPGHRPAMRELSIPDIQYVVVHELIDDIVHILRIWHTLEDR